MRGINKFLSQTNLSQKFCREKLSHFVTVLLVLKFHVTRFIWF